MKCNLSEDINKCPFYNKDDKSCSNRKNNKCSFLVKEIKKQETGYERKPRWYEKYYGR